MSKIYSGALVLASGLALVSSSVWAAKPVEFKMTDESSVEWVRFLSENRDLNKDWAKLLDDAGFSKEARAEKAQCTVKINRPEINDKVPGTRMTWKELTPQEKKIVDEMTKDNRIECAFSTKDKKYSVNLSLKDIPLDSWGTRFESLPFSLYGPRAGDLFESLRRTYVARGENDPMYSQIFLCDPNANECIEEYFLNQKPEKQESPMAVGCSRDSEFSSKVVDTVKAMVADFQKKNPNPTPEQVKAFQASVAAYWDKIWGVKDGQEAIQDQINRGVRVVDQSQCTWLNP